MVKRIEKRRVLMRYKKSDPVGSPIKMTQGIIANNDRISYF